MSSSQQRKISEVWISARPGHNESRMQLKIVDKKNHGSSPFMKSSGYHYTSNETPEFKRDANLFKWFYGTPEPNDPVRPKQCICWFTFNGASCLFVPSYRVESCRPQ